MKENSDPKHYEPDGLGILDPYQFPWILDMMDPLREYGLSNEILEAAFVPFQAQDIEKDQTVRLVRVAEHILDSEEPLFALPNVKDGDKGKTSEEQNNWRNVVIDFGGIAIVARSEADAVEQIWQEWRELMVRHDCIGMATVQISVEEIGRAHV